MQTTFTIYTIGSRNERTVSFKRIKWSSWITSTTKLTSWIWERIDLPTWVLLSENTGIQMSTARCFWLPRDALSRLPVRWKDCTKIRHIRLMLLTTLIFPIFVYGARKADQRIDAFQTWVYRRMLRISWMEKRTNEYILKDLGVHMRPSFICFLQFFAFVVHQQEYNLKKSLSRVKLMNKDAQCDG